MTSSPFPGACPKANISTGFPWVINISLTANRYHAAMLKPSTNKNSFRTGERTGIWLAFLVALGLHAVILFLPVTQKSPLTDDKHSQIEVELIKVTQQPQALPEPIEIPEVIPPATEPVTQPLERMVEAKPEAPPATPEAEIKPEQLESDFDTLGISDKKQLTNAILSAQFITEESVTEQIFGKQFDLKIADPQQELHFPARQSMIAMLDQPMPEVPFAYTPGLVRFAYDPGVKGDLQRFWDVITPEFGWRTKNGTEFKCIWVLIIGGCGWK